MVKHIGRSPLCYYGETHWQVTTVIMVKHIDRSQLLLWLNTLVGHNFYDGETHWQVTTVIMVKHIDRSQLLLW